MSGSGTFAGTTYQARVIAHIYGHILAQAQLGWLPPFNDVPLGVSGETGGPGDDAELEFGERLPAVEVQAKHGLTGGGKLFEAVMSVRERSKADSDTRVIFVVDRSSSRTVHLEFAEDLGRLRSGRTDGLKAEAKRLLDEFGGDSKLLHRLYVVPVDLDHDHDPETKVTLQLIESVLEDRSQVRAALSVLLEDAGDVSTRRLRRTRKDLVDLLTGRNIKVRAPTTDEKVMHQLDLSKRLLASSQADAVLAILDVVEADTDLRKLEAGARYRLAQHRAAALLELGKFAQALTSARQALDVNAAGKHALLTAADASVRLGDLESAKSFVDRAVQACPDDLDAWAAKLQVAAFAGEQLPQAPASVLGSESYQMALVQIGSNAADWPRVLQLTDELLTCGVRSPQMLTLRIEALLRSSANDREKNLDAERLATEGIEACADHNRLKVHLLVQRAQARSALGNIAGRDEDVSKAHAIDKENPETVGLLAQSYLSAGRTADALQLLRTSLPDEHPPLLVIRAQALAASGDDIAAKHDIDVALGRLDEAPQPDELRLLAAEVALALDDVVLAERILESVESSAVAPEMQATMRGRLAFARGDIDAGIGLFTQAADHAPELQPVILAELGSRLLRLGKPADAIKAFDQINLRDMRQNAKNDFAAALMEANELVRAAELIDRLAGDGPMPDWALGMKADLAMRQGDIEGALETLQILYDRNPQNHRIALELVARLIGNGNTATAEPYLEALAADTSLPAAALMRTAHLLKDVGRIEEAATLAFKAFRKEPHHPAMHRGLAMLLITAPPTIPQPLEVTADTYVKLVADDGSEREYIIYTDGPIDPVRKEIAFVEAEKAGYIGKRVGDSFTTSTGSFERTWTVVEILPAIVYVGRDVTTHYADRFPGEPFAFEMFKLPDEHSVRMFAPIIATLNSRRARFDAVLRMYHEQILPLGFVASMLDVSIAAVMTLAAERDESVGALMVEWFNAEGQEESRDATRHAKDVIVTRSALETLSHLNLLDRIVASYNYIAPRSLQVALRQELADAEKNVASGYAGLHAGDTGLDLNEIPAQHPVLIAAADRVRTILKWVESNARIELRPLESIPPLGSKEEQARKTLGQDSDDAVQLTVHTQGTMFADDLGLRKYLAASGPGRSFSTIGLLPTLAERRIISNDERDALLLQLVDRRYKVVPATRTLLCAGLRRAGNVPSDVIRVLALLIDPGLELPEAAHVAAEVLRAQTVAPVQMLNLQSLVTIVLETLAVRWPAGLCAHALLTAAAIEFILLPQHFETVRSTAAAFVKART